MALIIIGCICLLVAGIDLGIAIKRGTPSLVPAVLIALIFGILLIGYGISARCTATRRYNEMLVTKEYIETNWESEDLMIYFEVQDQYRSYIFKLDRIKSDESIFSPYWGLDVTKLTLEVSQK